MSSRKQFWILFGLTVLFVGPHYLLHGTNVFTNSYRLGAERFAAHSSPYASAAGIADQFKYSPFFAIIYRPFVNLPPRLHAFLWGVIGAWVFWWGITAWLPTKSTSLNPLVVVGLVLASMELDGSLRSQQINPLIVGGVLLAAHWFRDRRFFSAGVLIALLTNIKILPIIFALILASPFRFRYALGFLVGFLFAFAIPAYLVGWETSLLWHREWLVVLWKDSAASGILDLRSALAKSGLVTPRWLVTVALTAATFPLIGKLRRDNRGLALALSLGFSYLLLVSPRTESPTFVLVAPCYLFLLPIIMQQPFTRKMISLSLYLIGAFLITVSMNDVWPRWVWNPASLQQLNKSYGVACLWICALLLSLRNQEAESYSHLGKTNDSPAL